MSNQKVASRALKDHKFAQRVLTGEEDYPEVRDAILADLFESTTQVTGRPKGRSKRSSKVKVETRFIDAGPRFGPMGPCYVKYYPKMPAADAWRQWNEFPRLNLKRIAAVKSD
jgi:hypothetical protein